MAIALISSINKTVSGTIDTPAGTTLVIACVEGSTVAPKIAGVDMLSVSTIDATSICPALGIFQYTTPAIDTLAFTFTGTFVHFLFLSGADSFRPGSIHGYNSGGVFSGDMVTNALDLVIGILASTIGPSTLKGDGTGFTYLVNTATEKVGYYTPASASVACEAKDTGTTEGYTITGETHHNPAYLISAAYFDYPATWVPGHWYTVHTMGADEQRWAPGHYEYPQTFHPAVWHDAWDTKDPDIVVPAGTSQISACLCSIRATPGGGFVSRPRAFQ